MKKTLVMVLMVVAIAMPSKAQVKFGLQAGLNMTNPSVKNILNGNMKSRTGFFVGPTVQFSLPLIGLGFDASALYDQREGKITYGESGFSNIIRAQSIQIPINVRYGFGMANLAEVFFFAGPQFGFNLGNDKPLIITSLDEVPNNYGWKPESSNLSANVGLGATVLGHLQAKINYNFVLSKTGEFKYDKPTKVFDELMPTEKGEKFNTWQVSVAYLF